MKGFWPFAACVLLIILLWRFVVPVVLIAGTVGGALFLVERVFGLKLFPEKHRGG